MMTASEAAASETLVSVMAPTPRSMTRIDTSGTTFPTLVYYIYEEGFRNFRMGYAVTLSWALLVILIVFTVVQFRLQRRWVHYE